MSSGGSMPFCAAPGCAFICAENACDVFDDLTIQPWPEPDRNDEEAHAIWRRDYQQWRNVRCACGRGYFCRRHALWIPGGHVRNGLALPRERELEGDCPSTHYAQGYQDEAAPVETQLNDQQPPRIEYYGQDGPSSSSSSRRQRSNTEDPGRSSRHGSRPHRRQRSDRHPTRTERRYNEQDEIDVSSQYTASPVQSGGELPSTDGTYSSYQHLDDVASTSTFPAPYSYVQQSYYDPNSLIQTTDQVTYNATTGTYEQDIATRMGDVSLDEAAYTQAQNDAPNPYQGQEEDDTITEQPSEHRSRTHRSSRHRRRSTRH